MPRSIPAAATVLGLVFAAVPATLIASPAEAAKPRTFKNCTALNKVYPHGVGRPGARDQTSGKPVTTFKRNGKVYAANTKSDRDKDGIACEKA
ncbi:excalibur calcium-binding domain-containing protein [Nocardioides pantholopis]|uniref:excalibur calcium-binding domain-containing protein n=1 Tax=Nocardioides pantholopis TaxID=2483798 RepID=UPI000FD75F2B|nr:excalibur calcium-binding domain-containing protein [Nocardioides pantholopis]